MMLALSGAFWRYKHNVVWQLSNKGEWGFWFRIFGRGIHVTNEIPVFSERIGVTKPFVVFGVKIKYLPKRG